MIFLLIIVLSIVLFFVFKSINKTPNKNSSLLVNDNELEIDETENLILHQYKNELLNGENLYENLNQIIAELDSSDEEIVQNALTKYQILAKYILMKHKKGESTGAAPKLIEKFKNDFPEFAKYE